MVKSSEMNRLVFKFVNFVNEIVFLDLVATIVTDVDSATLFEA